MSSNVSSNRPWCISISMKGRAVVPVVARLCRLVPVSARNAARLWVSASAHIVVPT